MESANRNPGALVGEGFRPLPRSVVVPTMAGVVLAIFLAALDQTVVGTALPRIIADLGGFDRYTWVTTAYMVASTSIVPIVGRLTDMYGRKGFYIAGIIIFLAGSVLAGLSQTMNQLIIFRAIQGLGGGIMMANAFVAIGDLFPPAERGKYQGFIAAAFGLSSVVGPTLGGFITDTLSWHWIFLINIPLGIPVIAVFIRFFPNVKPKGVKHQIDFLGTLTLVVAVVSLLLGLSWGGVQYPWGSPQVIGALVTAGVVGILFILTELRAREPIIPFSIFRNQVVSISMLVVFLTGFGMFGAIIFIPLFFQGVLGASATSSGSFLTPMTLSIPVAAAISGQVLSRLGGHYRLQGLVGLVLMGIGVFLVSRMSVNTAYAQAVFNIVLIGLGLGITFPAYTIAVQNAVPYRVMGVATSSTQFFRSIGGTVGLAVLGAFMVSRFSGGLSNSLPSAVRQALPSEVVDQLTRSPQALFNEAGSSGLRQIFDQLGPQGAQLAQSLAAALKQALASAISDVFIISLAAVVLAFVATLFLKEIPLQRWQRQSEDKPKEATPGPVAGGGA